MTTTTTRAIEHAIALLQKPSITPNDAGCQEYLSQKLSAIGFKCQQFDRGQTKNLYAEIGSTGPCILFIGHTDVVPTGNESDWAAPPFAAKIIDDKIIARGVVDMKGAIAAMLAACEDIAAHDNNVFKKIKLAWLITSDEEGDGQDGIKYALEQAINHGLKADLCLVGEPTSEHKLADTIKPGRRGSLNCTLTITGQQGHAAYPELARNPIPAASELASKLAALNWPSDNALFPDSQLCISNFNAGLGAGNVIPQTATIKFNIRYAPNFNVKKSQTEIETIIAQTIKSASKLQVAIDWQHSAEAFYNTDAKYIDLVKAAICDVTGRCAKLSCNGGTSDGRFAAKHGWPIIELGLCNKTAHQINEQADLNDITQLQQVYGQILQKLLA